MFADVLKQLHKLEKKEIRQLIYTFLRKNKKHLNLWVYINLITLCIFKFVMN